MSDWYLIRTKSGKERSVRELLGPELVETFLPLLKTRTRRREHFVDSIVPLFPCYLFVTFELQLQYRTVRYTPGVREVLCAGNELLAVPAQIVEDLKRRCTGGPIELAPLSIQKGEYVQVIKGPFRGFEAIFENYISGTERVRILLSSLNIAGPRVVLPATSVAFSCHGDVASRRA
jgi:transcription antitermination factor NusG